jgi:hypothetical protein
MRRFVFILTLLLTQINRSNADVIYSPYTNFNFAGSIEFIGSYEWSFSSLNTINPWVGFGIVSSSLKSFSPSLGSELGLELRQYFLKDKFKGFNIGLYAGIAYMMNYSISQAHIYHENNSIGCVPGLKITYKIKQKPRMHFEPYIGISNPFSYTFNESNSLENLGIIYTIGIRIGFNELKIK